MTPALQYQKPLDGGGQTVKYIGSPRRKISFFSVWSVATMTYSWSLVATPEQTLFQELNKVKRWKRTINKADHQEEAGIVSYSDESHFSNIRKFVINVSCCFVC